MISGPKFFVICVAIFFLVGIPLHANATSNEFVGGYFNNSAATATSAILATSFTGTSLSSIPSGSWLASSVNIVGTVTYGSCPCFYQTGYIIDNTGNVAVTAQYWGTSGSLYSSQINNVGTTSSQALYGEIRAFQSSTTIQSQAFVYNTVSQIQSNSPTVYGFSYVYTGDTQFYYGLSPTTCGVNLQYYQVGTESPSIGAGTWYVNQWSAEVYTGSWQYQSAQSTEGNHDYYACTNGNTLHDIGGLAMTGVNINSATSGVDSPDWEYTGSTIGNGVSLWSSSGGNTPLPCQILGMC